MIYTAIVFFAVVFFYVFPFSVAGKGYFSLRGEVGTQINIMGFNFSLSKKLGKEREKKAERKVKHKSKQKGKLSALPIKYLLRCIYVKRMYAVLQLGIKSNPTFTSGILFLFNSFFAAIGKAFSFVEQAGTHITPYYSKDDCYLDVSLTIRINLFILTKMLVAVIISLFAHKINER